ncbi:hypothetical protein Moror_15023 [Moniliophthora roreri MCA 2997]|uniref:Uncharacterized protein n=1 Tax=Moniliophthora roreri (strain MCA 2997) TaxID=1381753 RepID=V2WRJ1_MONRO|nr:hypothetical protein Moror_15023 [Moniliophthora roreri MCA 2997]
MDTQLHYSDVMITEASIAVQFFFYGMYIVLFTICTRVLLQRRQHCYQYILIATSLLFFLISADVLLYAVDDAMWYCNLFGCRWQSEFIRERLCTAKFELLIASSAVADAILLWRCYTVWDGRWRVVLFPTLLYLSCHVTGFVLDAPQSQAVKEGYRSPSGLLIGSLDIAAIVAGAIGINNLLLSSLIGYQGEESLVLHDTFIDIGMRTWSSLAGIMSTIIIVRVALGTGFNQIEGTVTSMRTTVVSDNASVLDVYRRQDCMSGEERVDSTVLFKRDNAC